MTHVYSKNQVAFDKPTLLYCKHLGAMSSLFRVESLLAAVRRYRASQAGGLGTLTNSLDFVPADNAGYYPPASSCGVQFLSA